jgi:hypothetical protein
MITTSEITLSELKKLVKEENLLPFNREIAKSHVRKMMKSVNESGIIRDPLIGRMKYDGNRLAIVDGQHLVSAIVLLSKDRRFKNITCKIKDYETKSEVIKDISKVNNVQKTWGNQDFLDAWYKFGSSSNSKHWPNYCHLWSRFRSGNLPPGLTIDIYTNSKDAFKDGRLEFFDIDFSNEVYNFISALKREFDCPAHMLYGALYFLKSIRTTTNIDFNKLYSRLYDILKYEAYEEDDVKGREEFRAFVKQVYNKL